MPTNIGDACGVASVAITYYDDSSGSPVVIGTDATGGLAGGTTHSFAYPVGDTRVVVLVTDVNDNTRDCEIIVRVRDREAPVAVCTDITIFVDANGDAFVTPATLIGAGSSDNCSNLTIIGGQTAWGCADIGQTNLTTFTIVDDSGNQASCASLVDVQDNIAPTLVFANNDPNGASVTLDCTEPYIEIFPILQDNCNITGSVQISGTVDVNTPGTYTVEYNATDDAGNPATTLTRIVIVGNGLGSATGSISGPSNVCIDPTTPVTYTFVGTPPAGAQINWSYTGANLSLIHI